MIDPTVQQKIQAWPGWHTVGVIIAWVLVLTALSDLRGWLARRREKREGPHDE
jgi:hypothetical protein